MDNNGEYRDRKLLDINPTTILKFPFKLRKQTSCSMLLTNKTCHENVAFKVLTTDPKQYCVRPNFGIVLPGDTCNLTIQMQAQNYAPISDMLLRDKFLLQTAAVPHDTTPESITRETFEDGKNLVEEFKLKVMYVIPPDDESVKVRIRCQVCEMDSHVADMCPFMYTKCKVSKCGGICKLYIAKEANNSNRKFLKCQYSNCVGFQWLSDAILEAKGYSVAISNTVNVRCLQCGTQTKLCSCVAFACTKDYKSSKKENGHQGRKFLKCLFPSI